MVIFFLFFLVSGLSSLIYQVVWLRIAMANFGVTTPFVSIVLSVFMAGLALGSWAGGKFTQRFAERSASYFVRRYAMTELAIGISGLVVPPLLRAGRGLFEANSASASWGSSTYYLLSMGWILLVMLPFCTCMGATFPLAMAGIRAAFPKESPRSFSYLYLANVVGAIAGTLGSAFFLIEMLGFSRTLWVASSLNAVLAAGGFLAARTQRMTESYAQPSALPEAPAPPPVPPKQPTKSSTANRPSHTHLPAAPRLPSSDPLILPFLFLTGLCSLGMEVIWTRQFTPFLGPMVYSFAAMLAVYLGGARRLAHTCTGSG